MNRAGVGRSIYTCKASQPKCSDLELGHQSVRSRGIAGAQSELSEQEVGREFAKHPGNVVPWLSQG